MRAIPRKRGAALAAAILVIGAGIDYVGANPGIKSVVWAVGFALLMFV